MSVEAAAVYLMICGMCVCISVEVTAISVEETAVICECGSNGGMCECANNSGMCECRGEKKAYIKCRYV